MIIRGSRLEAGAHDDLCIDDEPIEEVMCMKNLGGQIDNLDLTTRKMAKKIGFLGRISKKFTCKTKTMIY
jgi:hypothetical protein